jgi:hypothetical protein
MTGDDGTRPASLWLYHTDTAQARESTATTAQAERGHRRHAAVEGVRGEGVAGGSLAGWNSTM